MAVTHLIISLHWDSERLKKTKPNNKQTNKTAEESDSTGVVGDSGLLRRYTEMFSKIVGEPHTEE